MGYDQRIRYYLKRCQIIMIFVKRGNIYTSFLVVYRVACRTLPSLGPQRPWFFLSWVSRSLGSTASIRSVKELMELVVSGVGAELNDQDVQLYISFNRLISISFLFIQ